MPWKPIPKPTRAEASDHRKYRKKARFLVDESVDPAVAGLLTSIGWSAPHVTEVGLAGHSDEDVLAFAHREDRILLTHDPDFLNNRRFPHHRNPGLIVLPGSQGNRQTVLDALNLVVRTVGISRDLWRATKISISDGQTWVVNTFEPDYGRVVQTKYRQVKRRRVEVWKDQ